MVTWNSPAKTSHTIQTPVNTPLCKILFAVISFLINPMTLMMNRVVLTVLLLFVCILSFSQSISVSPYSVYGIGVITDKSSGLNRSTGTGIAVRDPNNLNNYNPAAYTSVESSTQIFELGLYTESNLYRTSGESDNVSTGGLSGINAWFRFSKKWAGVVGLSPYSRVNYSIASTRNIGMDGGSNVVFSGTGGLSQFYFGNAFQITQGLSVGIDGSYLFGSIDKTESIVSGYGSGTILQSKVTANRVKADLGTQYSFRFKRKRSLTVGLTFTPQLRLNTGAERMLVHSAEGDTTVRDEIDVDDYVLPRAFGSGISLQTRRSTVALDVRYQEWSKATLEENVELRNTSRMSFSYTYEGNPSGESYWDFVLMKAGFYVQNNYLVLAKGSFDEWGLSAGVGLPLIGNRGTVNLSYHYNQSGAIRNGLIQQHSNIIVLDLTFREIWGIKRKFD